MGARQHVVDKTWQAFNLSDVAPACVKETKSPFVTPEKSPKKKPQESPQPLNVKPIVKWNLYTAVPAGTELLTCT